MEDIIKIAKKYNLYIIEDCAEALGSSFKNKLLGGLSDVSTFSFFGNKKQLQLVKAVWFQQMIKNYLKKLKI